MALEEPFQAELAEPMTAVEDETAHAAVDFGKRRLEEGEVGWRLRTVAVVVG